MGLAGSAESDSFLSDPELSTTVLENEVVCRGNESKKRTFPLAVQISATGLQGEKPLASRIMWVREVGKPDPYLRKKDWL